MFFHRFCLQFLPIAEVNCASFLVILCAAKQASTRMFGWSVSLSPLLHSAGANVGYSVIIVGVLLRQSGKSRRENKCVVPLSTFCGGAASLVEWSECPASLINSHIPDVS